MTISMLFTQEISFLPSLVVGVATGVACLALTIGVDSFFWDKWLWPEGVVLFFNTVENRSGEWGRMHPLWYFYSALPKAFSVQLAWMLLGLLGVKHTPSPAAWPLTLQRDPRVLYYTGVALAYVLLYSFLPHKELRFLFPVLPLFSLVSAITASQLLPPDSSELLYPLNHLTSETPTPTPADTATAASYYQHKKTDDTAKATPYKEQYYHTLYRVGICVCFIGAGFVCASLCSLSLSCAIHNYPGGEGLERLWAQHLEGEGGLSTIPGSSLTKPLFIHLDVPALMTGVSRFVQRRYVLPDGNHQVNCRASGYLNMDPEKYWGLHSSPDNSQQILAVCPYDRVIYSKNETRTSFRPFDYIITANPKPHLESGDFVEVESVYGFKQVRWSKYGPKVVIGPILYILQNNRE
eukprot:gene25115-30331_t